MTSQSPASSVRTDQSSALLCWRSRSRDRILLLLIRLAVPLAAIGAVWCSDINLLSTVLLTAFVMTMSGWWWRDCDAPVICLINDNQCQLILHSGRRLAVTPDSGFLSTHLQILSVLDASRRRHSVCAVAGVSSAEQQRQLRRLLLALPSLRGEHSV